jgi:hypothetical protein
LAKPQRGQQGVGKKTDDRAQESALKHRSECVGVSLAAPRGANQAHKHRSECVGVSLAAPRGANQAHIVREEQVPRFKQRDATLNYRSVDAGVLSGRGKTRYQRQSGHAVLLAPYIPSRTSSHSVQVESHADKKKLQEWVQD